MDQKVALITGASSGIGEATALLMQQHQFTVYGAARRTDKMKHLEEKGIHTLSMDVTQESSMVAGVQYILEKEGRIDVLVNNAGYGSYGAVEDVPMEEARKQFEVNIFGVARLTQLVLPQMRGRRQGCIINVSSIGGKIYTPFGAWYHATKHALEGWSDCLRLELKPFDIDVVIIEPGGINTPWGDIAADNLKKTSGKGAYAAQANFVADYMAKMYQNNKLTPPEVIAREIVKASTAHKPKYRYVKGYMARLSLLSRKWLGDRIYDRVIRSMSS